MLRAYCRRRFAPSLAESASRLEDRMVLSMAPAVVTPPITMPPSPAPGHGMSGPSAAEGGPVASPPIIWRGPYGG